MYENIKLKGEELKEEEIRKKERKRRKNTFPMGLGDMNIMYWIGGVLITLVFIEALLQRKKRSYRVGDFGVSFFPILKRDYTLKSCVSPTRLSPSLPLSLTYFL